ncbi:MAG: PKD domain-containing protein, partial [Planctomycetes bacterium]|nr:PKD domain-containing protein [Planctomycetota bacterium]
MPTCPFKESSRCVRWLSTPPLPFPFASRFPCYSLDFGDGVTGAGKSPLHVYLENGLYTVRLVVATADGKSTAAAMKVRVRPQYAQGVEGYDWRIQEYWGLVKDYSPSQLATRAALLLGDLAQETGHSEEAIRGWCTVF